MREEGRVLEETGAADLALAEHPSRRVLSHEVHARPYAVLHAPVRASHLAVATGESLADRPHLDELCARLGVEGPPAGADFFSCDCGGFSLRWERHTEFSTYTVFRTGAFARGGGVGHDVVFPSSRSPSMPTLSA